MPDPFTRRGFLRTSLASTAVAITRPSAAQSILDLPAPKADARISYGSDSNQFGDVRVPETRGPHPVLIFIHGGYWRAAYDLNHAGHLCAALTKAAGFATWNLEYRRIGQPGGGWPGTQNDVRQGSQYLSRLRQHYNLDLRNVIAAGHSAGGQLALWLGAQKSLELRAVVALAAVSDLRDAWALKLDSGIVADYLGGTPQQVPARYSSSSPIELLPIEAPQHILHGTADNIVPIEMSRRFSQASKNAHFVPIADAGHFELIDPRSRAWPVVLQTVKAVGAYNTALTRCPPLTGSPS